MAIKIQIEHGKILEMKAPFGEDKIFIHEYAKPRDNYWGPFPEKGILKEDDKRNGFSVSYPDFVKMVNGSDIGIWLEIKKFGTDSVSVTPQPYSQKNLEDDLKIEGQEKKLVISKNSLLNAMHIWEKNKKLKSNHIKFGIGENTSNDPIVFIHPDNNGAYNESDWPIRIPREN